MNVASPLILSINAGSSSVKFALITSSLPQRTEFSATIEGCDERAYRSLAERVEGYCPPSRLAAVGHRIVHGGPDLHVPRHVTPELLAKLQRIAPLAPVHMPAALRLIEYVSGRYPLLPQTVCFDTAFHHDMPRAAQLMAIPFRYQDAGVRRYGFHGLSFEFLMEEISTSETSALAGGRIILAHLGNGASLSAVHRRRPVETSMGFTPASGVPMGTRSGDIDPGLASYLLRTEGMDAERFERMLSRESGLLGLSGTSADMRVLLEREATDVRAADAVTHFCHRVRMQIGALAAALGGVDLLVFSGGIGEHAAPVRARICAGLEFLGIELDPARNELNELNEAHASSPGCISAHTANTKVRVIHTDEEMVIARAVLGLLDAHSTVRRA